MIDENNENYIKPLTKAEFIDYVNEFFPEDVGLVLYSAGADEYFNPYGYGEWPRPIDELDNDEYLPVGTTHVLDVA